MVTSSETLFASANPYGWPNMLQPCPGLKQSNNDKGWSKEWPERWPPGFPPHSSHWLPRNGEAQSLWRKGRASRNFLISVKDKDEYITIQLGVRIPFATPIAPKVETWGPAPPSGLLGTGRTRFRRASEHLSTSDSRCDPQKASNKNETNFMWYMDVVRVPLKRGQSWSCVPVSCLLVGILFSRLCQGITLFHARANPESFGFAHPRKHQPI